MFLWMKRGLVISSALLTIGLSVPTDDIREGEPQKELDEINETPLVYKINQDNYELFHDVLPSKSNQYIHRNVSSAAIMNKFIVKQAFEQSMSKFGETISGKIGRSFEETILPRINTVLPEITQTLTEEEWTHLKVTTSPSAGLGEKILHLYNEKTEEDIFRFHVRRDHPPKQGYYFNFHYHTYMDKYEKHHDLGTIYWGKDTPQKWSGEDYI